MRINKKTLKDLGFPQVLEMIKKHSLSYECSNRLNFEHFIFDREQLKQRQEKVSAIKNLIENPKVNNPFSFPSLEEVLEQLNSTYQNIDGYNLYLVASYIDSAKSFCSFLHSPVFDGKMNEKINSLIGEEIDEELLEYQKEIFFALDDSGKVKESHPSIKRLVMKVESARQRRQSFSRSFIKSHKDAMQSDVETIRDDRIVIPVKSDSKASVKGFVHSASSSGNTIFMEPYQLVEYNNEVVLAEQEIQIEIAKIYHNLSSMLRKNEEKVRVLSSLIINADILYTFASYASKNNCCATNLGSSSLNLLMARHPLLGQKAVPITFSIDENIKAVVLSGPNAGGKTVTIKTVGLFALLNQFMGFIPCHEGSSLPLFDKIYTDIGDEQSIEEELSTFSGHMNTLSKILKNSTKDSLVILDELGSGTDPAEGGAIACSVVDYLKDKSRLSLITSHQASLKLKAYGEDDLLNASMEFNEESHMPTFKVVCGLPGDSHAIDTAERMKLPKVVIERAKNYLGSDALEMGEIIKSLERKNEEVRQKIEQLNQRETILKNQKRKNELYELKLKQDEFLLKKNQSTELSRFVQQSRKDLEKLVSQLVTGELTKEKKKDVKAFINNLGSQEDSLLNKIKKEEEVLVKEKKEPFVLREGLEVLCGSSKREGTILKKDGKNRWIVQVGSMRITFKEKDLYQIDKLETTTSKKVLVSYQSNTPRPKTVLDVRGLTLEQSIEKVRDQIEACLVHDFHNFEIIHGYGDGILQRGIHEYLKLQNAVSDYRFALPNDGGMGKTYVVL